jgi:hypothetical protein
VPFSGQFCWVKRFPPVAWRGVGHLSAHVVWFKPNICLWLPSGLPIYHHNQRVAQTKRLPEFLFLRQSGRQMAFSFQHFSIPISWDNLGWVENAA